jgi:hypothetical protein
MKKLLAAVRWAVRTELRMYAGAARLIVRRPDVPDGARPVPYVGAVSALLWGFTGVSTVELVALHLIVPWEGVRLGLDILGIWGVLWCLGMTGCHYVYPHLLTELTLRVRLAARTDVVTVPLDALASVGTRERSHQGSRKVSVDESGVLVVAVGGRTNLALRLARSIEATVRGRSQLVREVQIYTDEARETGIALREHLRSGADRPT